MDIDKLKPMHITQKQINDLISKLASLSVEVNHYTKHDVFFEYSGHVDRLHIKVYIDGWYPSMSSFLLAEQLFDDWVKLTIEDEDNQRIFDKLTKTETRLKELLKNETK